MEGLNGDLTTLKDAISLSTCICPMINLPPLFRKLQRVQIGEIGLVKFGDPKGSLILSDNLT